VPAAALTDVSLGLRNGRREAEVDRAHLQRKRSWHRLDGAARRDAAPDASDDDSTLFQSY
jgi:hypothetical protein